MKGIRFDQVHSYVCKCDKGSPVLEQTSFKVRFLTASEQANLRDDMYEVAGVGTKRTEKLKTGSSTQKALELGLKGWENFKFDNGEEIPFSLDNFSCIPPNERDEISNYIRGVEEGAV